MSTELSEDAAATEALGARIAAGLAPGDVVLVNGDLGAGKTTLIRGACRALGVTEVVSSPTYTIGKRYTGEIAVSHLDLYRLDDFGAEVPGLLDDYLTADAIAFVEWPQRAAEGLLGDDAVRVVLRVTLSHAGGDRREVLLEPAA